MALTAAWLVNVNAARRAAVVTRNQVNKRAGSVTVNGGCTRLGIDTYRGGVGQKLEHFIVDSACCVSETGVCLEYLLKNGARPVQS
jgi:hypothetical protein